MPACEPRGGAVAGVVAASCVVVCASAVLPAPRGIGMTDAFTGRLLSLQADLAEPGVFDTEFTSSVIHLRRQET